MKKFKFKVYDLTSGRAVLYRETTRIEYAFLFAYGIQRFFITYEKNKSLKIQFDSTKSPAYYYDEYFNKLLYSILTEKQLNFFKKNFINKEFV